MRSVITYPPNATLVLPTPCFFSYPKTHVFSVLIDQSHPYRCPDAYPSIPVDIIIFSEEERTNQGTGSAQEQESGFRDYRSSSVDDFDNVDAGHRWTGDTVRCWGNACR